MKKILSSIKEFWADLDPFEKYLIEMLAITGLVMAFAGKGGFL